MRRAIVVVGLGLLALGLVGCWHAPLAWSPDGSWIAYVVEVRATDPVEDVGWMFDPARPIRPTRTGPVTAYRLWATRPTTSSSVLLDESIGPITAPGWSPDGHALAFGRVVPGASGAHRFEVVVMEGLTRRRVLSSEPVAALDGEAVRLPNQAVAWSPDGRFLAVPHLDPMGLAILRADNGRSVHVIPDAFLPSWAPAGGRLAFFVRVGDAHVLHWMDSALGEPRPLMDVGSAGQAPAWTRDGMSILVVSRRLSPAPRVISRRGPPRPTPSVVTPASLVRIRVDTEASEILRSLVDETSPSRTLPIEGTSITADRDGENVFSVVAQEGRPNEVTWFRPRDNAVVQKFPIVDQALPIGSLAVTPDGQTLAARAGAGDQLSAPLFCDPGTGAIRVRLAVPDDAARLDWILTLARTARLLLAGLPSAQVQLPGGPATVRRPTILPLITELSDNAELASRLRRIGQVGRPLCDRPTDAPPLDPAGVQLIAEARLFFDYLREDYPEALRTLEALESDAATPGRRLALMTVRAQALVNKGQFRSAERAIALLDEADRAIDRRVEWTPEGYRLTDEARDGQGWPRHLRDSVAQVRSSLAGGPPRDGDDPDPRSSSRRPGLLFPTSPPRPDFRPQRMDDGPLFRPNPRRDIPPDPGSR